MARTKRIAALLLTLLIFFAAAWAQADSGVVSGTTVSGTVRVYLSSIASNTSVDLTVDGCTFIGNAAYGTDEAISVGEGHSADQTPVTVTVKNSTFTGAWRRAISDNESGKREIQSYVISGNVFVGSDVNVSAYESIVFTGNEVDGCRAILTSYTNKDGVKIVKD